MTQRFRRDIEGLRAIAVVAVVLFHTAVPHFGGGFVGVDVFFVISGFLITGQLVRDEDQPPFTRMRQFYARRVRRILPAATLVTLVTLAVAALWQSPLVIEATRDDARAAMFFFANLRFAAQDTDYFQLGRAPSLFQHFWSLSLEEQFYFFWPAIVVAVAVFAPRRRRAWLGVVLVVAGVVSFVAGARATTTAPAYAFFALPFRAWELFVGAALAVFGARFASLPVGVLRAARIVGLAMILLAITQIDDAAPFPGTIALLPVAGAALVIFAGLNPHSGDGGLRWLPFQLGGRYSYSIYLWHWPVLQFVAQRYPEWAHTWPRHILVQLLVAVPLAVASYHLVENPARRRLTLRAPHVSLLTGAALVGVGALALVPYGAVGDRPLDTGKPIRATGVVSPDNPTEFVPANLNPSLRGAHTRRAARDLVRCLDRHDCIAGREHGAKTIVVFGDSHAGHWISAFAVAGRVNDWRVEVLSYGGCRSYPIGGNTETCDGFRARSNARIAQLRPDLVVFSNQSVTAYRQDRRGWLRGVKQAFDALPAGTPAVVLSETPIAPNNVPVCLSLHLGNPKACEPRRPSPWFDAFNRVLRKTAAENGAGFVDLTPWLCTATRCPVIMDDVLVYRDPNHFTNVFSRSRAGLLADALRPLLRP